MLGCSTFQAVEKRFFRTLNRYVEPTIRLGIGSPWLVPVGAVVMETVGRKSGKTYNIPVLASEVGDFLVASTVRGRSQWVKNVAAVPEISVWLRGRPRACTAYVISDGELSQPLSGNASTTLQLLVETLKPLSKTNLASFVILALEPASVVNEPAAEAVPIQV